MEPTTSKPISRRSALIAAGLGVASLASTSLTGCALTEGLQNQIAGGSQSQMSGESNESQNQPENQKKWDGSSYLPIGSVVKLESYAKTDINHAVITRRPNVSKYYTKDSSGNLSEKSVSTIKDYALVAWPMGIINDINQITGDVVLADAADIKEVLFIGYEDDLEKRAQSDLMAGKAEGKTNAQSLKGIASELLASIPSESN